MAPDYCPNCGAEVPRKAKACPECGSCAETGWSDEAYASGLGLPDDSFNYEEYVRSEFGAPSPKPRGISWFWWVMAIILVAALAFCWFRW